MAGRGPAPKEATKRARRNADPTPKTTLEKPAAKVKPPTFPAKGPLGLPWPAATRAWWKRWVESPQAAEFAATDWDFLLDTAVLHAALWHGDTKAAAELRLRVAKFGATVEDRARLRMTFGGEAPKGEAKAKVEPASRARYGELKVVGGTEAAK